MVYRTAHFILDWQDTGWVVMYMFPYLTVFMFISLQNITNISLILRKYLCRGLEVNVLIHNGARGKKAPGWRTDCHPSERPKQRERECILFPQGKCANLSPQGTFMKNLQNCLLFLFFRNVDKYCKIFRNILVYCILISSVIAQLKKINTETMYRIRNILVHQDTGYYGVKSKNHCRLSLSTNTP